MGNRRNSNRCNKDEDKDTKTYNPDKAKQRPRRRKPQGTNKMDATDRDNNPNWYFDDKLLAEQVSQLSFQQIAGVPMKTPSADTVPIANILRVLINPSPGVQMHQGQTLGQKSAINQAGFKLWSMISAYTGRQAVYGPQDISIMILYMGEVISVVEYLRRVFGCMFVWSDRDRTYPKQIISAMGIDPDDLMRNYSDYRTRFNSIVQRINQVPIPQGIAYFDKCAALYEKVYKDSPSGMAALIFMAPYTMWRLDETSDTRGTKLNTTTWLYQRDGNPTTYTTMGSYLVDLESIVSDLLTSSTFNVVYTDLLNLATKMSIQFWKFDYLTEGYIVTPEYNENFLLQLHNMTSVTRPAITQEVPAAGITPYNDVISDPNNNQLLYNPAFSITASGKPYKCICDLPTDMPTVETRVESLRFTSLAGDGYFTDSSSVYWQHEFALPDHYVVQFELIDPSGTIRAFDSFNAVGSMQAAALRGALQGLSQLAHIDWGPLWYGVKLFSTTSSGEQLYSIDDSACIGDLNFWTWVDYTWLRKVNDFVGIALYSIR